MSPHIIDIDRLWNEFIYPNSNNYVDLYEFDIIHTCDIGFSYRIPSLDNVIFIELYN